MMPKVEQYVARVLSEWYHFATQRVRDCGLIDAFGCA
jgi:hypothetical protein